MCTKILSLFICLICLSLPGCSDTLVASMVNATPVPVTKQSATIDFYTGITIREIMANLVDPQADIIWNAVRVVSDASGITGYHPKILSAFGALLEVACEACLRNYWYRTGI